MTDRKIHEIIQAQNTTENQALFGKIMARIADTSEGRANDCTASNRGGVLDDKSL